MEAALRSYHVGADVTVSYRGGTFPERVKYWLRPEINMLIDTGRIACHFHTVPVAIAPDRVRLQSTADGTTIDVDSDHVLVMIGYHADMSLFKMAGVTLQTGRETPLHNEETMETSVPGVYVAGTAVAGTQQRYVVFLENCHIHVDRIVAALTGHAPPPPASPFKLPES